MKTISQLLSDVVWQFNNATTLEFSHRDVRTLKSLNEAMQSDLYITEKQGTLLQSILNSNLHKLSAFTDAADIIKNPQWSNPWRVLPEVRKLFFIPAGSNIIPKFSHSDSDNYSGYIGVEFTFSSTLRKILNDHSEIYQIRSGSFYIADLTESNLVSIFDLLAEYKFEVDTVLQQYYDIITSWNKEEYITQYEISNIPYPMFQKHLIDDIGETTTLDSLIINDRRNRYCYTNRIESNTGTLTETIANRDSTKIWIDNTKYNLTDIVKSLIELKRLPLLVVFDQSTDLNTIAQMNMVSQALIENNINDNIGIYFRLDNTPDGKIFNDVIGKRQYNCKLDKLTQVAGVRAGKLPKFFLQSDWKPMSVISINNSLRQSKTAVYARCCDLIISYTNIEPIIETRTIWE